MQKCDVKMLLLQYVVLLLVTESFSSEDVKDFTIEIRWPYNDGWKPSTMHVKCLTPKTLDVDPYTSVEVANEDTGKTLESIPFSRHANFSFLPSDTRILGKLSCRLDKKWTKNSGIVFFQICQDEDQICQNSQCEVDDKIKFCFTKRREKEPRLCDSIDDKSWCNLETDAYTYCPINKGGFCKATIDGYEKTWFRIPSTKQCPENVAEPPMSYKEVAILYGQPIAIDKSEKFIRFKCPPSGPFHGKTLEDNSLELGSPLKISPNCDSEMKIEFSESAFTSGTKQFSLMLSFDGKEIFFNYRAIIFGTEVEIVGASPDRSRITCRLTSKISPEFRVTKWLTKNSTRKDKIEEGPLLTSHQNWSIACNESDWYQCHAVIELKICSPHRTFKSEIQSQIVRQCHPSNNGNVLQHKCLLCILLLSLVAYL